MLIRSLRRSVAASLLCIAVAMAPMQAQALSLVDAIQIALDANPEIGQAIENRIAIDFELQQALGLYAPRLDLEASVGAQLLSTPSRRAAGIADDPLYPAQVGLNMTYDIFDGGFRDAEKQRQAARSDGAAFRVLERSEFISLEIARQYIEVMLQARVVQLARENVQFHQTTLSSVTESVSSGTLTEADRQQAMERLGSATARLLESMEAFELAKITFLRLVGIPFDSGNAPPRVGAALPNTLDQAIGLARVHNPRVHIAAADVDAAAAVVEQSKAGLLPKLSFEGGARIGEDVGGTDGWTSDLQGRLVLRWNLYDGGIKRNEVQENTHRETEAMYVQQQVFREVEEAVRVSWERIRSQTRLSGEYGNQLAASQQLVTSYREQFSIGERSLLDVLDAQNTRFSVQILAETARFGALFSEYRLLAATGTLVSFLGVDVPREAGAGTRQLFDVPGAETYQPRTLTPVPFQQRLDLTNYVN